MRRPGAVALSALLLPGAAAPSWAALAPRLARPAARHANPRAAAPLLPLPAAVLPPALAVPGDASVPAPASPAAGAPAVPASAAAWAEVEAWAARRLGVTLAPGKTERWALRAAEIARDDPSAAFEGVLAKAFSEVHALPAAEQERAERVFFGRPLASPIKGWGKLGMWGPAPVKWVVHEGRSYAFAADGVYEYGEDKRWTLRWPGGGVKKLESHPQGLLALRGDGSGIELPPVPGDPAKGWRAALLDSVAGGAVPPPPAGAEADGGAGGEGRALFSGMRRAVTSLLGRAAAAFGAADESLWTSLEGWAAEALGLTLQPGRTREWERRTEELLRGDPALPLDAALARALAETHRLPDASRADAERLFSGWTPRTELPGVRVSRLVPRPEGLYALAYDGLYLRKDGAWSRVFVPADRSGGFRLDFHAEAGEELIFASDRSVYAADARGVRPAIKGVHAADFLVHGGRTYLSAGDGGLFVRGRDGWERVDGFPSGHAGPMAVVRGRLHVGVEDGVLRRDRTGWTLLAAGAGKVSKLQAAGDRLYLQTQRHRDFMRVWMLKGDEARRLFDGVRYNHYLWKTPGEGAYADAGDHVYELTADGPKALWEGLHFQAFSAGTDLFVRGNGVVHRRSGGRWTSHRWSKQLDVPFFYRGRTFVGALVGLFEASGDELIPRLGGAITHGLETERGLLVATTDGVVRVDDGPAGAPADWRERLLAGMGQRLERASASPVSGADGVDDAGRSLFSGMRWAVTSLLGRAAAAFGEDDGLDAWRELERWAEPYLREPLAPGLTGAWARRAAALLRDRPGSRLEETLARALAETHGLSREDEAGAGELFAGRGRRLLSDVELRLFATSREAYVAPRSGGLFRLGAGRLQRVSGISHAQNAAADGDVLRVAAPSGIYEVRDGRAVLVVGGRRFSEVGAVVRHRGEEYLPVGELLVRRDGAWTHEGLEDRTRLLAEAGGDLYAAGGDSVSRMTEGAWTRVLEGRGDVASLVPHGDKVYVRTYITKRRPPSLYEIDRSGPRLVLPEAGRAGDVVSHAGRLFYAAGDHERQRVYQLKPSGWDRVLDVEGAIGQFREIGGDLYFGTGPAWYRESDGLWRLVAGAGSVGGMPLHAGRRYVAMTGGRQGLYEVDGGVWTLRLPGVEDAVSDGDWLYLKTNRGVTALFAPASSRRDWTSPPSGPDWRGPILDRLGSDAALLGDGGASAGEGEGGEGRSLFSGMRRAVTSLLGRAATAFGEGDPWAAAEAWIADSLGLEAGDGRAWRDGVAARLRERPDAPLDETLAAALVRARGWADGERVRVEAVLRGEPAPQLAVKEASLLLARPEGLYAFSEDGLHALKDGVWTWALPAARDALVEDGGAHYFSDGETVHVLDGGAPRPLVEGAGVLNGRPIVRHRGTEYLPTGRGLLARRGGGWEPVLDAPPSVEALAVAGGRLFAAGRDGILMKDGREWKPLLTGVQESGALAVHQGKLYVDSIGRKADQTLDERIDEIDARGARRQLVGEGRGAYGPFVHGGRLYARVMSDKLYEKGPEGWRRTLGDGGAVYETLIAHGELYVRTSLGLFRRTADGWEALAARPDRLIAPLVHQGARCVVTQDGLYEVRPGGWVRRASVKDVYSAASAGRWVYFATKTGVSRADLGPAGLHDGWKDALLRSAGASLDARAGRADAAPAALEADPAVDGDGRALFSGLSSLRRRFRSRAP